MTGAPASLRSSIESVAARARRTSLAFVLNRRRVRFAARRGLPAGLIRSVPSGGERLVALSFDDGPSAANTPELLEILANSHARATFFVVGSEVLRHPQLVSRITDAGHEIGNHSFSHANPRHIDEDTFRTDVEHAAQAIADAGGESRLFRPPFGKGSRSAARLCADLKLVAVLWSVDSGDTMSFSADRIAKEVIENVEPGDIVLMHDGGPYRPRSIEATRQIVAELTARGYRFVTISELLGRTKAPSG